MAACRFSVVIPVRNDAVALGRTLDRLTGLRGIESAEIIVAASEGSSGIPDAIRARAQCVWSRASTRAALMNLGAAAASGEILFFLHADSVPPANALVLMDEAVADSRVVGGAFEHRFAEADWRLGAITRINRLRYRLTRNYYGDQGIFVRRDTFRRLGGYQALGLLEDLEFSRRLKRVGRPVLLPAPVETSGRRFLARGPWCTFLFIGWLLFLSTLRLDTERYAERWRGPADRSPGSPWPRGKRRGRRNAESLPFGGASQGVKTEALRAGEPQDEFIG